MVFPIQEVTSVAVGEKMLRLFYCSNYTQGITSLFALDEVKINYILFIITLF